MFTAMSVNIHRDAEIDAALRRIYEGETAPRRGSDPRTRRGGSLGGATRRTRRARSGRARAHGRAGNRDKQPTRLYDSTIARSPLR